MRRRHQIVAQTFAPVIIQNSNAPFTAEGKENGDAFRDFITRVDYDDDWFGYNNEENLEGADQNASVDLRGYLYYAVQETLSYYYIHYVYFHPVESTLIRQKSLNRICTCTSSRKKLH